MNRAASAGRAAAIEDEAAFRTQGVGPVIPEAKQSAVSRALWDAFGVREFEAIHLLTGGLSTALVFRVVVLGNPYLLRIIMRTDTYGDLTGQVACMKSACEAGIAPRVVYADLEDRILITEFVEAKPFPDDMALRMASTIRKLHSLPPFPKPKFAGNYFDTMDAFVRRLQAAKLLPEDVTEELFVRYADVARMYPRNQADLVSSHNDLKPQNTLFDGDRVWLVDWEAAFLNDRYFDLAVAANFFVQDEQQEQDYLREYLGEPAGEFRSARFYITRQAVHMIYAAFLMLLAVSGGAAVDPDLNVPEFADFHRRLISGEVNVALADQKVQYAKVHLVQLLSNMRTQRFKNALARVASQPSA